MSLFVMDAYNRESGLVNKLWNKRDGKRRARAKEPRLQAARRQKQTTVRRKGSGPHLTTSHS